MDSFWNPLQTCSAVLKCNFHSYLSQQKDKWSKIEDIDHPHKPVQEHGCPWSWLEAQLPVFQRGVKHFLEKKWNQKNQKQKPTIKLVSTNISLTPTTLQKKSEASLILYNILYGLILFFFT